MALVLCYGDSVDKYKLYRGAQVPVGPDPLSRLLEAMLPVAVLVLVPAVVVVFAGVHLLR
jgi:hypothetical protein